MAQLFYQPFKCLILLASLSLAPEQKWYISRSIKQKQSPKLLQQSQIGQFQYCGILCTLCLLNRNKDNCNARA